MDLKKLAKQKNIKMIDLAKCLCQDVKNPRHALDYLIKTKKELSVSQLVSLSELIDVPLAKLIEMQRQEAS